MHPRVFFTAGLTTGLATGLTLALSLLPLSARGAGPAVAPTCPGPAPDGDLQSGGCAALPGAIVTLQALGKVNPRCDGNPDGTGRQLALLRSGADGSKRRLSAPPELAKRLREISCIGDVSRFVHIVGSGDLDGDGQPELLLTLTESPHEDFQRPELQVWTVRKDNALVRYARDPKLPAVYGGTATELVRDVDHDGRPDLLHPGPYLEVKLPERGLIGETHVPPLFLYHAQSDGTFSTSDAAARAHLAAYCGRRPPPLAEQSPNGPSLVERLTKRVVCARAYGVSAATLDKEFAPRCQAWNARDFEDEAEVDPNAKPAATCPDWLQELTRITPPVRLDPPAR